MSNSHHTHHAAPSDSLSLSERLNDAFSQYGFMPHGHCYLWKPLLVSIHVISDVLIGIAYFSISLTLYFLVKKTNLAFNRVVWCFGIFIGACGLTHLMEVWNLWNADYWWSAWIKVITAAASVATGVYLFKLRHSIVNVAELAKLSEERRVELEDLQNRNTVEIAFLKDEFATLANNISQLAWMADREGNLYWYNNRWYDYTGTTPDQMHGWGWEQVHDPDHLLRVKNSWLKSLSSGEDWEETFPLKGKDGKYRWFLSRAKSIKDQNGTVLKWFGTNTDIEEQRELMVKLEANTETLNKALKIRDEFLSIASHELKTPLTSLTLQVQQNLKMIKNNDPAVFEKERITKNADQTYRLIGRLNRLVEDMLDVSKIKAGQLIVNLGSNDLLKTAQVVLERLENFFTVHKVRTPVIEIKGQTQAVFDPSRLEQVVSNLIENALKYGNGQPISLTIESDARSVSLSVKDNGIGINPELKERIFNRFERGVDPNEVSGFGLGLFISKEIMDAHNGSISAVSIAGQGSTFKITLPKDLSHE